MKCIKLMIMAVLLAIVGRTHADILKVADVELKAGETKEITIELDNSSKQYAAFQFDLVLPNGISIAKNSNGKLIACLNEDRIDDHILNVSDMGSNTYRFLSFSMTNAEYDGTSGTLVKVTLRAADASGSGAKTATIKSQVFTDVDGNQTKWSDFNFSILDGVCLDKIEVIVKKNNSLTLKATVYPSTLEDRSVTWKSSDESIATVTSSGKVKGIKSGIVTITCRSNATGEKATCKVIVATITLNKSSVILNQGKTVTLTPTVYPTTLEDKSVIWESSDKTIATVTSAGKVKGVKGGTATITCTSNATGLSTTCIVTVNAVSLDQSDVILKKKKTLTLKATVYPETLEDKSVKWESSDKTIATVSSSGKITGVKTGTITITCTSVATGAKATCKVTVATITLDQTNVVVRKNKTVTLTPTVYPTTLEDKSVKWKSSDKTIATVSSSGTVKGVKTGTVTITCTSVATGLSTTCKVTVGTITLDQTKVVVRKNKTVTLTPTVYPTTLTDKSVKWESSDKTIATVSSSGKVKGIKTGTVTITCTSVATGLSTTCKVIVGTITLSKSSATIIVGENVTLKPTVYPTTLEDQSVKWKSSDKTVATVSSSGKVTGMKAGTATITCTSVATGLSTTCKVTVTASSGVRTLNGDDDDVTGIENLEVTPAVKEPFDVYNMQGHKLLHQVTSLDGLPAGVYIVNGKKVLKK